MFGFPRQSRDSCTTRLFLLAHAQTKVPSVFVHYFWNARKQRISKHCNEHSKPINEQIPYMNMKSNLKLRVFNIL